MKKHFKYALAGMVIILFSTCKKKTDIEVTVYSYALNEPVANAKIALVQRKLNAFGATYTCEEIDNKITDADGKCRFNSERLKTSGSFKYYTAVTEAYGKTRDLPCGDVGSDFLVPGKINSEIFDIGIIPAFLKVQYNNLFNPAQSGDSLLVGISNPRYQVPGQPHPVGGGGVFTSFPSYNGTVPASVILLETQKTDAGKNLVHIRKRKMGVVTTSVDTVKIYPYETKIIEINW